MNDRQHEIAGIVVDERTDRAVSGVRVEVWTREWPATIIPVDVPTTLLTDLPPEIENRLFATYLGSIETDDDGRFQLELSVDASPSETETGPRDDERIDRDGVFLRLFDGDRYLTSETCDAERLTERLTIAVPHGTMNRVVPTAAAALTTVLAGCGWLFGRGDGDETSTSDEDSTTPVDGRSQGVDSPDPALAGPALPSLAQSTAFLYEGDDARQTGVDDGVIEPERAAVLRGRVTDRDGDPIEGATVAVLDHPEYGQTTTDGEGVLDMAVNGDAPLTLAYRHDSYLPAQRTVQPPRQDFTWAPDVVLLEADSEVTPVAFGTDQPQAVRASQSVDDDGPRRPTLYVPPGTVAMVEDENGPDAPENLDLRVTEYTVGDAGPDAMPGLLPPSSGYTHAIEFGADGIEAGEGTTQRPFIAAGGKEVSFDRPLSYYVENFVGFPVGGIVPMGAYDPAGDEWAASQNGRVVTVLGTGGGRATLDVDGNGRAASASALAELGLDEDELAWLASTYTARTELWRVPVPHFSAWDANWGTALPADAVRQTIQIAADALTSMAFPPVAVDSTSPAVSPSPSAASSASPTSSSPPPLTPSSQPAPTLPSAPSVPTPVTTPELRRLTPLNNQLSNQTRDFIRQGGSGINGPFETHWPQPGSDPWTREEIVDVGDRAALEAAELGSPGRWFHPDGHVYETWNLRDPFTGRQTGQWVVTGVIEEAPRPRLKPFPDDWRPYSSVEGDRAYFPRSVSMGSVTCSVEG